MPSCTLKLMITVASVFFWFHFLMGNRSERAAMTPVGRAGSEDRRVNHQIGRGLSWFQSFLLKQLKITQRLKTTQVAVVSNINVQIASHRHLTHIFWCFGRNKPTNSGPPLVAWSQNISRPRRCWLRGLVRRKTGYEPCWVCGDMATTMFDVMKCHEYLVNLYKFHTSCLGHDENPWSFALPRHRWQEPAVGPLPDQKSAVSPEVPQLQRNDKHPKNSQLFAAMFCYGSLVYVPNRSFCMCQNLQKQTSNGFGMCHHKWHRS